MLAIIAVLLAVVLFCVSICVFMNNGWNGYLGVVVTVGVPVLFLAGFFAWNDSHCGIYSPQTVELYSGTNGSVASGHLFLGTGTIDETEYVYYWQENDGVLTKNKVQMRLSSFVEDGNHYMLVKEYKCDSKLFYDSNVTKYEFHVPKNSVSDMYKFY